MKNKLSRELKNLQPRSIVKDDDDFRDVDSPYPGVTADYVYPERDCTEDLRCQNLECSTIALQYYNKKNRTNYELVEAVQSSAFLCPPIYAHVNFTAKPKEIPDGDGHDSTKLFAAELLDQSGRWVATACCILKGKSCGCDFCGDDSIKHPTQGFRMRQNVYRPYNLRPRTRGYAVA